MAVSDQICSEKEHQFVHAAQDLFFFFFCCSRSYFGNIHKWRNITRGEGITTFVKVGMKVLIGQPFYGGDEKRSKMDVDSIDERRLSTR